MVHNAFIPPTPCVSAHASLRKPSTKPLTYSFQTTLKLNAAETRSSSVSHATAAIASNALTTLSSTIPMVLPTKLFPSPLTGVGGGRTIVVWFRSDLRLHDHPALTQAIKEAAEGGTVLPVFIFDSRSFGKTEFGFEKTGRYRAKFLIESVTALREMLRNLGSDLIVRVGKSDEILPVICRAIRADVVLTHKEVTLDDTVNDERTATALSNIGVDIQSFWANTLYDAADLPFDVNDLPDVYASFREAVQTQCKVRTPLPTPCRMPSLPGRTVLAGDIPSLAQLGLTEPAPGSNDGESPLAFKGGESEALARVAAYVHDWKDMSDEHTAAVHLGTDFSCKISPWLSVGCVSARKIYAELVNSGCKAAVTTTFFELVWRDFFRFVTAKYNKSSHPRRAGENGGIQKTSMRRRRFSRTLVGGGL